MLIGESFQNLAAWLPSLPPLLQSLLQMGPDAGAGDPEWKRPRPALEDPQSREADRRPPPRPGWGHQLPFRTPSGSTVHR